MKFGEKLKDLRIKNRLTQNELAEKLGVSLRTLQNYETCKIYPRKLDTYNKIAKLFHISTDYLLQEENTISPTRSDTELDAIVAQVGSLFSGGALSEEDKDKVLCAITDLYWKAKMENQK